MLNLQKYPRQFHIISTQFIGTQNPTDVSRITSLISNVQQIQFNSNTYELIPLSSPSFTSKSLLKLLLLFNKTYSIQISDSKCSSKELFLPETSKRINIKDIKISDPEGRLILHIKFDKYWNAIENSWKQNPEERYTIEEIEKVLNMLNQGLIKN